MYILMEHLVQYSTIPSRTVSGKHFPSDFLLAQFRDAANEKRTGNIEGQMWTDATRRAPFQWPRLREAEREGICSTNKQNYFKQKVAEGRTCAIICRDRNRSVNHMEIFSTVRDTKLACSQNLRPEPQIVLKPRTDCTVHG